MSMLSRISILILVICWVFLNVSSAENTRRHGRKVHERKNTPHKACSACRSAKKQTNVPYDSFSGGISQSDLLRAEVEGPQDEAEFRALLGRGSWRLLHTMAARYPDNPDDSRIRNTAEFFELFSHLFPCPRCAADFRMLLAQDPIMPHLRRQADFSLWLCEIHNKVNRRLGKPHFPCENVDQLYDCGCDIGSDDSDDIGPAMKPIRPWDE